MKKLNILLLAMMLGMAGCNRPETTAVSNVEKSSKEQQIYNDVQKLSSFSAGNLMAAHTVYVLFDPQCPHCGRFWNEVKGVKGINFKWIPVAFMNNKSAPQGAAIMSSSDSSSLMNTHEDLLAQQKGGIVAGDIKPEDMAKVQTNTNYWKKNFESVPMVIFQNEKSKNYIVNTGGMPKEKLLQEIGMTP